MAIDISTGLVEMAAPLVAGTIATEIAIKVAKIVRTNVMAELSGEATLKVNLHAQSCDHGASKSTDLKSITKPLHRGAGIMASDE